MSKLKTNSSVKKRFRFTATGKLKCGFAFKRHNLRKRSQDMKRSARGTGIVDHSEVKRVKKAFIPYGLR